MPSGQPLSPGFHISNLKKSIYQNLSYKKTKQPLEWLQLVRNSPKKILAVCSTLFLLCHMMIRKNVLTFLTGLRVS